MRGKENADDYRYFPDPDLVPLEISDERIEQVRAALPELPEARRARFEAEYAVSADAAQRLTASRALADFFEEAARLSGAPRAAANWVARDLAAVLREAELEIEQSALAPAALAALVRLVEAGRVTPRSARSLLLELVREGGDPEALVRERGLESVADESLLAAVVDEVLAGHREIAAKVAAGDAKALNFLMGQVMRRTQGKADPARVRALLEARLGGSD
jgi:aspartyl-tRNA(Asn)/glutamyl-tRNA(Gln) amidotransferase subunit B